MVDVLNQCKDHIHTSIRKVLLPFVSAIKKKLHTFEVSIPQLGDKIEKEIHRIAFHSTEERLFITFLLNPKTLSHIIHSDLLSVFLYILWLSSLKRYLQHHPFPKQRDSELLKIIH